MKYSRREILRYAGLSGLVLPGIGTGCVRPRPESRMIPSLAPLPAPFQVPLPVISSLKPLRSDTGVDFYDVTVRPANARILPGMDTQIWGYDGLFPGPTVEARVGRRVSLRLRNALPVPIVNHLHGGRTDPESDGYPTDFIMPAGGFPRSHMPDPLARISDGEREYMYQNNQRASTLWYHDHRMDFTAPQVWRGLAGFYILRDPEEERIGLPRGDKEIALLICDRSFHQDGSFRYPALDPSLRDTPGVEAAYMGGVLGDVILVNGAPWPKLEVANVQYRFRILNASNREEIRSRTKQRRGFVGADRQRWRTAGRAAPAAKYSNCPLRAIRCNRRFLQMSGGIDGHACEQAGRWTGWSDHAFRHYAE